MKTNKNIIWFTLVEVLVAMTILAIVMVSVLMIYAASAQIALKTDINREMQQNIKSIVESIAEDIRLDEITAVSSQIWTYKMLDDPLLTDMYFSGSSLQVWENKYYLVLKKNISSNLRVWDINECNQIKNTCVLVKSNSTGLVGPLSNSKISISNLNFAVSNWEIPKVTISFVARAAIKNGLRPDIIKNSTLNFQTTISERSLHIK